MEHWSRMQKRMFRRQDEWSTPRLDSTETLHVVGGQWGWGAAGTPIEVLPQLKEEIEAQEAYQVKRQAQYLIQGVGGQGV